MHPNYFILVYILEKARSRPFVVGVFFFSKPTLSRVFNLLVGSFPKTFCWQCKSCLASDSVLTWLSLRHPPTVSRWLVQCFYVTLPSCVMLNFKHPLQQVMVLLLARVVVLLDCLTINPPMVGDSLQLCLWKTLDGQNCHNNPDPITMSIYF